jgi:hypothetical protein
LKCCELYYKPKKTHCYDFLSLFDGEAPRFLELLNAAVIRVRHDDLGTCLNEPAKKN